MKTFNEWMQEKININEISSDLLDRAAGVAQNRGDNRGQRLSDKFSQAATNRGYDEFIKDPNKIEVLGVNLKVDNAVSAGYGYKIHCTGYKAENGQMHGEPLKYILYVDLPKSDPDRGSINGMYSLVLQNVTHATPPAKVRGLNRRTANIISKLINVKPTELPLE